MDFLEDQVAEEDEYQQDASILVLLLLFWLDITEKVDAVSLKSKITNNFRNQTHSPRETQKKKKKSQKNNLITNNFYHNRTHSPEPAETNS